jgi:hypothetical protein
MSNANWMKRFHHNNATTGTLTNYLDIGAATNKPSRFYRARLAP